MSYSRHISLFYTNSYKTDEDRATADDTSPITHTLEPTEEQLLKVTDNKNLPYGAAPPFEPVTHIMTQNNHAHSI